MQKKTVTVGSLFAGVGGICLGFKNASDENKEYEISFANEIDEYACATYRHNFSHPLLQGDINMILHPEKSDNPEYYQELHNKMFKKPIDVLNGGFPCLTGDTLILTESGYKKITDVLPGEKVLSHDNEWHKILNFMDQGEKDIYKIKASGFLDIKATGNHRFFVTKSKYSGRATWKSVDEIIEGKLTSGEVYYMGCPVNTESKYPEWSGIVIKINKYTEVNKQEILFDEEAFDSETFWYIAGKYVRSGWLRKPNKGLNNRYPYNGIVIGCNKNETNALAERISKLYHCVVSHEKTNDKIHITNTELAMFMSQFGDRLEEKHIPGFVYDLPKADVKSFVDGFTDADRCTDEKVAVYSINKSLLYGLTHCVHKAYEAPCHFKNKNGERTVVIEGRSVDASASYMMSFSLKNQETDEYFDNGYIWYPIRKIEPFGKEHVYDIEVAISHSFIANGCVTHNCQAFSIAGERRGFEDERGNLFLSIVDAIQQFDKELGQKPRILFLENVKNLMSHDKGRTYRVIKSKLEENGYIIKEAVLNTMDYTDVPQNRERFYIIGFLNKEDADKFTMFDNLDKYRLPKKTKDERLKINASIIDETVDNPKYFYTKEKYPHYFEEEGTPTKKNVRVNISEDMTEKDQFYQLRRGLYIRQNKSFVCPTLTANMGTGGHNVPLVLTDKGIRKITAEEAFKLQGFPVGNGYELPTEYKGKPFAESHLYKQAGNSVSVPVITLIAKELLKLF